MRVCFLVVVCIIAALFDAVNGQLKFGGVTWVPPYAVPVAGKTGPASYAVKTTYADDKCGGSVYSVSTYYGLCVAVQSSVNNKVTEQLTTYSTDDTYLYADTRKWAYTNYQGPSTCTEVAVTGSPAYQSNQNPITGNTLENTSGSYTAAQTTTKSKFTKACSLDNTYSNAVFYSKFDTATSDTSDLGFTVTYYADKTALSNPIQKTVYPKISDGSCFPIGTTASAKIIYDNTNAVQQVSVLTYGSSTTCDGKPTYSNLFDLGAIYGVSGVAPTTSGLPTLTTSTPFVSGSSAGIGSSTFTPTTKVNGVTVSSGTYKAITSSGLVGETAFCYSGTGVPVPSTDFGITPYSTSGAFYNPTKSFSNSPAYSAIATPTNPYYTLTPEANAACTTAATCANTATLDALNSVNCCKNGLKIENPNGGAFSNSANTDNGNDWYTCSSTSGVTAYVVYSFTSAPAASKDIYGTIALLALIPIGVGIFYGTRSFFTKRTPVPTKDLETELPLVPTGETA